MEVRLAERRWRHASGGGRRRQRQSARGPRCYSHPAMIGRVSRPWAHVIKGHQERGWTMEHPLHGSDHPPPS